MGNSRWVLPLVLCSFAEVTRATVVSSLTKGSILQERVSPKSDRGLRGKGLTDFTTRHLADSHLLTFWVVARGVLIRLAPNQVPRDQLDVRNNLGWAELVGGCSRHE